jgi:hypothetical protein
MTNLSPQTKGYVAELKVICALINKGCKVFKSCCEDCRYDLVFEFNNILYKVQVKLARYDSKKGRIEIFARSMKTNISDSGPIYFPRSYKGEIDHFGIYCPELDKCYLIPEEELPVKGTSISLRIDPVKNNQKLKIRYAKDYEL